MNELMSCEDALARLTAGRLRLIDVRAPVEFLAGKIPNSINLPILDDEERARVGTVYKQEGSARAIALGHELVHGEKKALRIRRWTEAVLQDPQNTIFTCFRGGMRSQLAQAWTAEAKAPVPRLAGGYKKMRRLLIERLEEFGREGSLLVLSGKTGAGKTLLLNSDLRMPALDLEFLAKHRGSAFGAKAEPQPTQIDFENELALNLVRLGHKQVILVEDESRLIGRSVLPERFFDRLRASPVVVLDEPMDVRVENTLREYVVARAGDPKLYSSLQDDLYKIRARLGGLRYAEVAADIRHAQLAYREHQDHGPSRVWIEKLLGWYYDPLYEKSWRKREPRELARGTRAEILKYLNSGDLEQIASVSDGRN